MSRKAPRTPVMPVSCATCPFRDDSPYEYLRDYLTQSALTGSSRICHSTGRSAIHGNTKRPKKLCRGARDLQLRMFHQMGFITDPTDQAWDAKRDEMGI